MSDGDSALDRSIGSSGGTNIGSIESHDNDDKTHILERQQSAEDKKGTDLNTTFPEKDRDGKETLVDADIEYSSKTPFQLVNLLKDSRVPFADDIKPIISCIEAWDLNLYIGTKTGEIIHFYRIDDDLGYIQISKQKFSSSSSHPVKKILLLPEISIALVHCGSLMSAYLLPEFSPANIGKAKDVTDLSIDWKDLCVDKRKKNKITKSNDYNGDAYVNVTLFTRKAIRLLRIFKDGIRLHKEFQYTGAVTGIQLGNYSIVSNNENYDLIDISESQKFFLFPLSTSTNQVIFSPIIEFVSDKEALLVCGGENENDPAMGMFINTNGDIVRGTLAFEKYPQSVCVDYPYILATLDRKLVVYSIVDQTVLQTIEVGKDYGENNLTISTTSRIFSLKDHDLTQKITLAPIVFTMDNDEMERITIEADKAAKKSVILTSSILFDYKGDFFRLLQPISDIDKWLQIFENTSKLNCDSSYEELYSYITPKEQNGFLIEILGLFTIYFELFNQAFEIWTSYPKYLDPRLMVYMFNGETSEGIYGSVWTYQSLFDKFETIKKREKEKEMNDLYKLYLNTSLAYEFENDNFNIKKSIEVALVKYMLANNEDLNHTIQEVKYSQNEIIEILLLNKQYYYLSMIYSKLHDHRQWLYYWKGMIDGSFLDKKYTQEFEDKNKALQIFVNYILANCTDDVENVTEYIEWLIVHFPKFGLKLATDDKLIGLDLNELRVSNLLDETADDIMEKRFYKITYFEYIFHDRKKKQFAGDLVLLYLDCIMGIYDKDDTLKSDLKESAADYMKLKVPKLSIVKYWNVFKKTHNMSTLFIELHDKLCHHLSHIDGQMKTVLDQIPVLETCEQKILDSECKDTFPLISLIIYYRSMNYDAVIDFLIRWKDYYMAEQFAAQLNLDMKQFEDNTNKETILKIEDDKHLWDENDIGRDSSSLKLAEDNKLSERLLKRVFDAYLKNNETGMIDHFLNKFDLLNDTTLGAPGMSDKIDRFVEMMDRIPDSFPLERLSLFLVRNLLEFNDCSSKIDLKKNLLKSEVNKKAKIAKRLQSRDLDQESNRLNV